MKLVDMTIGVMRGKACVLGTRVPVELVLKRLGGGASMEEILEAYPSLTEEGVRKALLWVAQLARFVYVRAGRSPWEGQRGPPATPCRSGSHEASAG